MSHIGVICHLYNTELFSVNNNYYKQKKSSLTLLHDIETHHFSTLTSLCQLVTSYNVLLEHDLKNINEITISHILHNLCS